MSNHTYSDGEHTWLVRDLWAAAEGVPVEEVQLLDLPLSDWCWESEVDFSGFVLHVKRVMDADRNRPIVIGPTGWVLDGMHRIAGALARGEVRIKAQRLDVMPDPATLSETETVEDPTP